jgi:hypothetical protein
MWALLATILVRPRQTIRSIVTESRSRAIALLVLLATASAVIRDVRWQAYRHSPQLHSMAPSGWIIACVLVGVFLAAILFFYAFAFVAWGVGRLLGGSSEQRTVRLAVAWSLAPVIWALLYRVPVALFAPAMLAKSAGLGDLITVFRSMAASMSASVVVTAVIVAVLNLAVALWAAVIASVALSEVNRFSIWRGAATLIFSLLAPLIVIAAFLISRG